ncbi:hypothetical protein GH714_007738 [Hevea brasiliensis]|uniref:Uncharacterized protein n=1 Tax=Hevea brasiliensis TaxID=3981 RepID=A0A6A6KBJ9_HEVBR|nr:hypothetical protein GH714_007738 [Hevea brasiliensis]
MPILCIVLKEAKLTKKGKCDANVANWNVIETLVILSGDLVQVIAKGVLFPADGFMGNVASDDVEAAVVSVPSSEIIVSESEESNKSAIDKRKINENRVKKLLILQLLEANLCLSETKADGEGQKMTKLLPNGVSCDPTFALVNQTINALKGPLLQEALLQVPFVQVFQLLPMHRLMWPQNHVLVC